MPDQDLRPVRRAALPRPRRVVLCEVMVESYTFGTFRALLSNVNCGGAFIEMVDPLPLGAEFLVRFGYGAVTMVAFVRVQQHVTLNFATREKEPDALAGMVVRFLAFASGEAADAETFH